MYRVLLVDDDAHIQNTNEIYLTKHGCEVFCAYNGSRALEIAAMRSLDAALENLCYNALSFTPGDGTVSLLLSREGGKAVISVADTGIGIDAKDLPYVFDNGFTRREVERATAWACLSSRL